MDESRAAYEAAIRKYHEEEVTDEVRFVARELCVRAGKDPEKIVTCLHGSPMLRVGQGEYAMERYYVPAWANYADLAQSAIDAVRAWNVTRHR